MGGVGTAALEHPDVEINIDRQEVIAPKSFFQSKYRDNGSLRDVDVFVASSNPVRIQAVEAQLEATVGDELERRVFGIHPHETLSAQLARPMGTRVVRMFTSDRYEVFPDVSGVYVKSLFPFAVPVEDESIEPWMLVTEGGEVPIPNPGITIANYTNRDIVGLRFKDTPKVNEMTRNILAKEPLLREWLYDGPGKSQLELSTLIASLRHPDQRQFELVEGIAVGTLSYGELLHHERLLIPDAPTPQKMAVLSLQIAKANAYGWIQSSKFVNDTWQRLNLERRVDGIVTNN